MPTPRIDQINNVSGFPEKVKNVPAVWPTVPAPGKLSLLWQYNYENLWHRFSPYTTGDNAFGIFPNKQPFVYRYPDEGQESLFYQLPAAVKTLASAGNITQDTTDDVVRVSKFLISPQGIIYNTKQFALQRGNVFDETRTYNPLTPILATVGALTFGIGDRPMRHIEGGFLSGLLDSVTATVGINLASGFKKPDSTAGTQDALPNENKRQGKGMIRGASAANALVSLKNRWSETSPTGDRVGFGDALSSLGSSIASSFKSFFGSPAKSPGRYRADEGTFELMRISKGKLDSYDKDGADVKMEVKYYPKDKTYDKTKTILTDTEYKDFVAEKKFTKVPSKLSDSADPAVQSVSDALKAALVGLQKNDIYNVNTNTYSRLLSSGNPAAIGYDYLMRSVPAKGTPKNQYGVTAEYYSTFNVPRTIDRTTSNDNLRMAASFVSDALNQVGVIGKDKKVSGISQYPGYTEYKPYEDDLIAFFFYDVVNQKYIPFRATVKGMSEGNTAFWDELRFIGRADQLYSYNGFSRTFSFTFNVVVSSISELLPTWQKINYMASCVKPSNYTNGKKNADNRYSRFIVPPMFMLTIGDLYKYQPIVITSVNVNIPDDATWETLNEDNSKQWSYLNGIIKSPAVGKKYAQLPLEAELAITCNLLEKERAILGGSHFGHAPRIDEWENLPRDARFLVGGQPFLPKITEFHAEEVVFNDSAMATSNPTTRELFDAGTPANPRLEQIGRTA